MDKAVDKGVNTFHQGNPDSLKILSFVAILLLLIGLFNFIHISSVVIIKRGRELGMKRYSGQGQHNYSSSYTQRIWY